MDWLDIKEFLKDSIKVVASILVILIIVQYIFSFTKVVGSSMDPTLKDNELLIQNKLHYRLKKVKRGDIISLKYADTKYLIKRVIGLPGEKISIKNSKVYINDKVYDEPYISDTLEYEDFDLQSQGIDTIPEDMYFVLGDNRANSLDSRKIGLIKKEDIIGKISFRFWPLNRIKIIKNDTK